jgi:hypothetical protein
MSVLVFGFELLIVYGAVPELIDLGRRLRKQRPQAVPIASRSLVRRK